MALTLVIGPANSAKAGEVLGAYTAACHRGALLVVPTVLDAEHYARELAGDGALLGSVVTFGGLAGEMARRAGFARALLTHLQRERVLARAIASARFETLAEPARSPGFRRAAGELVAELERSLVTPQRFAQALARWAAEDERRSGYARELAALYFGYRREVERAGRLDGELYAWQALDALRAAPAAWGQSPVFFYGFDDLHELELDAIETLARSVGVEVTVSLTYEPGRAALAARAHAAEQLRPVADRVVEMPALDTHYHPDSRSALHHLERGLFEPGRARAPADGAVALLEAGGERAEAELVAAEILGLVRKGMAPEEIAVLVRSPARSAAVLTRVFAQYGVEFALEREVPLAATALGRGLLALARCALQDPRRVPAGELVAYLRAPGVLASADEADEFEARLERTGVRTVLQARPLAPRTLDEIDSLRAAPDRLDELAGQARRLLVGRGAGHAPVLGALEEQDARACAAVIDACAELAELGVEIGGEDLVEVLEGVRVPAGSPVRPGAVLISDPLAIRARRFRAVVIAGLCEGEFPRAAMPDPFLSDELRRELAVSSGLRLRPREDALPAERYLLYAALSRASERLVLSYRSSDEEGNLALPSPFLRDVADLLDEGWWERRRRRLLADVVWDPVEAPTEAERRRALAAAAGELAGAQRPPAAHHLSPVALAQVRHTEVVSSGALETFSDCPIKWLVERQLEPELLEVTPEPLARGSLMHDTLERVLRRLGEAVTERSLSRALDLLGEELTALPADIAPGAPPGVRAAALRAIDADLRRYLEHEARDGSRWPPVHLERRFGFDEDSLPVLELGLETGAAGDAEVLRDAGAAGDAELVRDAQPVRVRGVIDRIDVDPDGRRAVVRDYKSGSVRQEFQATRWAADRRLQVALYMLAVRELLGLEPVGGFYQPLRGGELRARGVFLRGAEVGDCVYASDGREPEELDALLEDARSRAVALAARLRAGVLEPCPATCSRDGCRYPGICRSA